MRATKSHKTSRMIVALFLLLAACGLFQSWQVVYLNTAVNHATQGDIIQRMGSPQQRRTLDGGGSVLGYQFREYQAGDLNGPGRWWCDEYQLRFDREEILRQWSKIGCSR